MKRVWLLMTIVLFTYAVPHAQTPAKPAKPDEQARIQPLIAAETTARDALNKKAEALPEMKAYRDAQEALRKAGAALEKAINALPEKEALKTVSSKTLDEAARIQAAHGLSAREFEPRLDDKGKLIFLPRSPAQ